MTIKLTIFDAEIIKAIPPKNPTDRLDNIQYCDGWTDYANIGMIKTGHGELAPIMWQRGDEQGVVDYCENDAKIEAGVAKLLLNGELIDPNTGNLLRGNFTNA
jgi:hypothetical protein